MPPFESLRRLVSPITLLLGVVCFLLPFCAVSCAGTDLIKASGVSLVVGGDASIDCHALDQISNSLNNAFANSFNDIGSGSTRSSSSSTTSSSSGCTTDGSSTATATPGTPSKLGLFDGKGSSGDFVHVAEQPMAAVAAALLLLGALVGLARGRTGAMWGFLLGLAAAAALVILRIAATGSFNSDLDAANAADKSSSSVSLGSDLNPFQLTWGTGWWLALGAACVGSAISVLGLMGPRAATAVGAGWGPPPGAPPPGAPPPGQPWGQPPPGPPWAQPPPGVPPAPPPG